MNQSLVARTMMSINTTSDLVTYEALIGMHVLCILEKRKLDGVHIHGIRVLIRSNGAEDRTISSRGNIVMISRT